MDGALSMPSMEGQPPMTNNVMPMGNEEELNNDPSMDSQSPMDDNNPTDDSTVSIINQLSDEDREAVRAYAESMLDKQENIDTPNEEDTAIDGGQMMESITISKKELQNLMENFGPTEDELQFQDDRKPLSRKRGHNVSNNSPFNSPKFN